MKATLFGAFLLAANVGVAANDVSVFASKNNNFSLTADVEITANTEEACVQKFNELAQKIEVTNRILLNARPCKFSSEKYRGSLHVATI